MRQVRRHRSTLDARRCRFGQLKRGSITKTRFRSPRGLIARAPTHLLSAAGGHRQAVQVDFLLGRAEASLRVPPGRRCRSEGATVARRRRACDRRSARGIVK